MTTATASADLTPRAVTRDRTPFGRLVKVELRKLYDTRAGFWLLAVIAGLTVASLVAGMLLMKAETAPSITSSASQPFRRASCCPCWGSSPSPASGVSARGW